MLLNHIISQIKDDHPVDDVRVCLRSCLVKSRHVGLAHNFARPHRSEKKIEIRNVGELTSLAGLELARYALSSDFVEASIGVAAINSLITPEEAICEELNAADILFDMGRGRRVAVVGHFPFVKRLRTEAGHLDVLELNPQVGDLPAEAATKVIPGADVVAITATALINHTMDNLLELAKDSFTIVLGPTTPLTTVFFDYGVDIICGTQVIDEERVIRYISQGASFKELSGIRQLAIRR